MSITIAFRDEPSIQLATKEDIQVWANEELAFWQKFREAFGRGVLPQALNWNSVESGFNQLRGVAGGRTEDVQTAANNITSYISFSSRHALAKFMGKVLDSGESAVTVALMYALHRQPETFRQAMHQQDMMAEAFKAAYYLTSFRLKNHPLSDDAFVETFSAYQRETESALKQAQSLVRSLEKGRTEWADRSQKTVETQSKTFDDEITKFKTDLTTTQKEYAEKFALRAPMDYWSSKAKKHDENARLYRNWFVGMLAAGVVISSVVAYCWLLEELKDRPTVYWPVILFSALVAVLAWPVRLASKLYLSQKHLFEDSSEREVIARTFLALMDTVKMENEDRKILLNALFRDSTAGLVKDDHPVNVLDAVSGIFRK